MSKLYPDNYKNIISFLKDANNYEYVINIDNNKTYIPSPNGVVFEIQLNEGYMRGIFDREVLVAIVKALKVVANGNNRVSAILQCITMFTGIE